MNIPFNIIIIFILEYTSFSQSQIVSTDKGLVRGFESENAYIWQGIPFAASPTGNLRWKPPHEHGGWAGVLNATSYGPSCNQLAARRNYITSTSEDCLKLHIWSPKSTFNSTWKEFEESTTLYPVMIWIHGGAFRLGGPQDFDGLYEPEKLVSKGKVVVVEIQYRLGPLGFLAHPSLSKESPTKSSGNYGIMDGIAAIKWVKRNIRAFKGDPDNLTAFGESAGACLASFYCLVPELNGVLSKVIIQSAPDVPMPDLATMSTLGTKYQLAMGCNQQTDEEILNCMRSKDVETVMETLWDDPRVVFWHTGRNKTAWIPIIDGYLIQDGLLQTAKQHKFNDISIMMGTNAHEGSLFFALTFLMMVPKIDKITYRSIIKTAFPNVPLDEILEKYPISEYDNLKDALIDIHSDLLWASFTRTFLTEAFKSGKDTYLYYFSHIPKIGIAGNLLGDLKSGHGSELNFIFQNKQFKDDEERYLADQMMKYWVQFAYSGNPNKEVGILPSIKVPEWPLYKFEDRKVANLSNPITIENDIRRDQLEMWYKYYPNGIETVEELDLIDEPWVSYLVNNHGRRIIIRLLKAHPITLGIVLLTSISPFIYLCLCCRKKKPAPVKEKKE